MNEKFPTTLENFQTYFCTCLLDAINQSQIAATIIICMNQLVSYKMFDEPFSRDSVCTNRDLSFFSCFYILEKLVFQAIPFFFFNA